jgi:hypothetical protein
MVFGIQGRARLYMHKRVWSSHCCFPKAVIIKDCAEIYFLIIISVVRAVRRRVLDRVTSREGRSVGLCMGNERQDLESRL